MKPQNLYVNIDDALEKAKEKLRKYRQREAEKVCIAN